VIGGLRPTPPAYADSAALTEDTLSRRRRLSGDELRRPTWDDDSDMAHVAGRIGWYRP
jgi:hypothetical protein